MRNITWQMTVDPITFQPVAVLHVDKISTEVQYSIEAVMDLKVLYGENYKYIFDPMIKLEEDITRLTDLTAEERAFAVGPGFKPTYTEEQRAWRGEIKILEEMFMEV